MSLSINFKRLFMFLSLLAASGCATSKGYDNILDTWLNADKKEFMDTWGIPSRKYKLDKNTEYISYVASYTFFKDEEIKRGRCETTFSVENNKITAWRHEGNICKSCNEDFWGPLCKILYKEDLKYKKQ